MTSVILYMAMSGDGGMRLQQWLGDGHGNTVEGFRPATRKAGSSSTSSCPPRR